MGLRWMGEIFMALCLATAPAWAADLVGDCNSDFLVTVDEIVAGVTIAIGDSALERCPAADADGNGEVTIDELIRAVGELLNGPTLPRVAFITATDFQAGGFATISLDEPRQVHPAGPATLTGSDAVARVFGARVFVVNRFGGDNLQVLDAGRNFAGVTQCSTGPGSNPNDIAFVNGHKAYIPLYGRSELLVVDPNPAEDCSNFIRNSIDLSEYADADGIPEMSQVVVVGDRVYVTLQRLASFMPAGKGAVVVIDTNTDEVVDVIELTGENPFGQTKGLTVQGGSLYVAEVGNFGVLDGGIERINLATGRAEGFIITEETLGGDLSDFVLVGPQLGYAILSLADFSNSLVAFDPTAGTVLRTVVHGNGLSDIEINSKGELYLTDRNTKTPGVRIFRAEDGAELTTTPLNTGLPPFSVVFLE